MENTNIIRSNLQRMIMIWKRSKVFWVDLRLRWQNPVNGRENAKSTGLWVERV